MNCWDVTKCGHEPNGANALHGVCPAATCRAAHGTHFGHNAGRACWAIDGTLCGFPRASMARDKMDACLRCTFYRQVRSEEGDAALSIADIRSLVYGSRTFTAPL